jgi:hypothetical protein
MTGHRHSAPPPIDLSNGSMAAWTTGPDATAHFTVAVARRRDGSLRIRIRRDVAL